MDICREDGENECALKRSLRYFREYRGFTITKRKQKHKEFYV